MITRKAGRNIWWCWTGLNGAGAGLALVAGLVTAASAASINVAFHNGTTTLGGMTSRPAGQMVNSAAQTWNNIVNTGGPGLNFTNAGLLDETGAASGSTLTCLAGYSGYNNNGWGSQSQDYAMMEGWYGFRSTENLAVSNLPPAITSNGYKVVLFGDANTARTMNYTLGGITKTITDSATFSGAFEPFTVTFSGLSNASFTVTGNPNASDSRSAINGLQIIANPPPPPSLPGAVGINFHHSASGQLAAGDVAGVVPMAGWQNVDVGDFGNFTNYSFPSTSLSFGDGAQGAGTLEITLTSGYNGTTPAGSFTPDRALMSEYISWDPVDGTSPEDTGNISVTGLAPAFTTNGYDVFVYCDADTTGRTFTLRIGTNTIVASDRGTFVGTYLPATKGNSANYARFRQLTAPDFLLEMDSDTGRAAVNALQIIPTASLPFELEVNHFQAAPKRIQPGGMATLAWNVLGATGVEITPNIGDVTALTTNGIGSISVSPTNTTTYTLTLTNAQASLSATATARVVVGPPVPNILFFLVDDMGWQDTSEPFNYDAAGNPLISALNQRYRTPNMERLAAHALKFTTAYAAPVCTPTRVSLMTGKSTARHRVTNWTAVNGSGTDNSGVSTLQPPSGWLRTGIAATETNTLPRLLSQAGYRTIHAGKAHFGCIGAYGQYPQNLGFEVNIAGSEIGHPASYYGTDNFGAGSHHVPGLEQYHGSNIFLTEALTLEMNQQIERAVAEDTPFFAYMAHYAVHTPWQSDPRFTTNYPGLSGNNLAFATLIEGMDQSLGDLLAKIEALGVAENTLVIFLTDNGGDNSNLPLRNKKGTLYEGGVRVPMLIGWAKTNSANPFQAALPIAAGGRVRDSVAAWDLYPTLLRQAGLAVPAGIDGCDLTGYLRGATNFHRPQQFAIHFPHNRSNGAATQKPGSLWRDGDWKLIYDYESGATQLYNLADDLAEANDLAAAQPSRVMAMTRALTRDLVRLGALWPEQLSNGVPVAPVMPDLPAVDVDVDGLPDLVEDPNRNGLSDPGETDPDDADTDHDGTPDGAEFRTGTDPLNPASNFVAWLTVTNGQPRELSWPGKTGSSYRVEKSYSLQPGAWTTVQDDIPGQDAMMHFNLDPAVQPAIQFYRVMLK